LPDKQRVPLILCYLHGQAQINVAKQLGLPLRTLEHHLAQGRELLRRRLVRRGVEWSAVLVALEMSVSAAPAALLRATAGAALAFVGFEAAVGVAASSRVVALAEGTSATMSVTRLAIASLVVCLAGVLAVATSWQGHAPSAVGQISNNEEEVAVQLVQ